MVDIKVSCFDGKSFKYSFKIYQTSLVSITQTNAASIYQMTLAMLSESAILKAFTMSTLKTISYFNHIIPLLIESLISNSPTSYHCYKEAPCHQARESMPYPRYLKTQGRKE